MAELTQEQFDQVPEFLKGEFEKSGDVFVTVDSLKLKSVKQSMNDLKVNTSKYEQRIADIEAKAEADRTKAEQSALEKLKKEGKVDEILADYEKRASETKAQYETRINKLAGTIKSATRSAIIADIATSLNVFDKGRKVFEKHISDRIDVDPETGKEIYLDENGGATSLDKAGFLAELEKDEGLYPLRQAQANKGGMANGNTSGGGASKVVTRSQFDAMNPSQRTEFTRSGGTLKD